VIALQTFGPFFDLPDPSPFVTKMDVLLKMSGVPFTSVVGDFRQAPKGKMPFIIEDGIKIGDSTLIRLHLENKFGVNFDKHLTAAEKGIAWAVEKMLEDSLYWAMVHARWMDDTSFSKGPAQFFQSMPSLIRPFVTRMVRKQVRRNLHGQGLGRHTTDEVVALGNKAIDAVAAVLGDKPYLMGAHKCGADATVFAFVLGVLCPLFDNPMRAHAETHKNLVAYCERMRQEFYSTNVSDLRAAA
jgi:glutathione S-transferase